jgi:hypothetical protein
MFSPFIMQDESLAKVLAKLEEKIGAERMSALRRRAAKKKVSVLTLLGDAVTSYLPKINNKEGAA